MQFPQSLPLSADDLDHAAAVVELLLEDLITSTLEGLTDAEEDALLPLEDKGLGETLALLQSLADQASGGKGW